MCVRARKCGCVFECVFVRDGVKMILCCVKMTACCVYFSVFTLSLRLWVCVCVRARKCVCVFECLFVRGGVKMTMCCVKMTSCCVKQACVASTLLCVAVSALLLYLSLSLSVSLSLVFWSFRVYLQAPGYECAWLPHAHEFK